MLNRWPLVGRTGELELVGDLLADGERSAVVLAGLAGVGKTRLASECLNLAEARGMATARIKGAESARRLPFGALAPLLPGTSGPGMEPGDMLMRARQEIAGLGRGRPLVLLVDDAHLLDDASATLVHQLAATRSAFVIATVRSKEPAPEPVVALWKDELAERVEVPPLTAADIDALLTDALGGRVSAGTLRQLAERSAGNALYLRELVLAGLESGALADEDGIWRLTGSPVSSRLVELIEGRLAGVQDPERKVLDALAFGEPLGVTCLSMLTTPDKLEELETRGLIVTAYDGRRLEACLAHPLYGEVIRARIPALRSQAVRKALADRVQAVGARRREDPLRFATWRLDAGGPMEPGLMVAAATTARDRWDLTLASRLADAAVRAGAGFDAAILQAEIAILQGRGEEAEEQLAALLPQAVDDAQRVRLIGARVDNLVSRLGRTEEALQAAEAGEALVSSAEARDQLVAKRAFALHLGGRLREAIEVLEPVLARAEGPSFAFAWYTGGACMARTGRFAEALLMSEKCGAAVVGTGRDAFRPSLDAVVRCSVLTGAGCLRAAEELAAGEYAAGVDLGSVTVQAIWALHLSRIEVAVGTVAVAVRHAIEARNLFRKKQWRNLSRTALAELALAHALGGSVDQAMAALAEIDAMQLPEDLNAVELGRARAWTAVAAGDLGTAHHHLATAVELANRRGDLVWESDALHDLARLGWAAEAAPRLAELAALVEGDLAPGRAEHAEALLADDAERLSRASADFERMGAWLVAAEAAAAAAVVLRRSGKPRPAASAELRAAELARRCQGAITPALRAIQTQALLSSREIEVAALAAAGMANREIAGRLSVSVRTVENHLQRVYDKLGVARRADLAQALGSI
ncbi:MAG TPA: LuxR C-terminal-related transcriptional regulator [Acidimicrobiales bacterium]|nr:LuxR C-terminal-related transcriptional regulator [Acidimicrobiales bacterium]